MERWHVRQRPTRWSSEAQPYPSRAAPGNFSSAEQPAEQSSNAAGSGDSCQQSAEQWIISASRYQVEVPKDMSSKPV